ncbi:MAG TPA: hypothetical protein VF591_22415 [Pyrinomonadaceae bacterium]|jgi:hypothetical protein
MDLPIAIFVALLCLAAFLLTMTVRRDFRTRERLRREQQRHSQNARRKP